MSSTGTVKAAPRRNLVAATVSVVLCLAAAEAAVRGYWSHRGVPFSEPGQVLYAYYPELRAIDEARPRRGGDFYDVLLLGGSTLHTGWGSVARALDEQLTGAGVPRVRIFNLAWPAHTSRDSWLKYAALGDARFSLVVVYDGMNDVRVNNAPPDVFREDYSHYAWYESVNTLSGYYGHATVALPYTLRFLEIHARHAMFRNRYATAELPREDWFQYGKDLKGVASFASNLTRIADLASERRDPLLLMTFATYVPDNYSLEAFRNKQLDYGTYLTPLEMWGRRENVVAAVDAENAAVRKLAADRGVRLVDQAGLIPKSARYFNDACHLTAEGSAKFAENVVSALRISRSTR